MTPLIIALLRHFAGRSSGGERSLVTATAAATEAELEWTFAAGLGPLLHASLGAARSSLSPILGERLLAADLTARVIVEQRVNAALDVVAACQRRGHGITLLKGISLSHFQYEAPHFRPMTDVDVLVPEEAVAALETELLEQGYWHAAPVMLPGSHHGEPLHDPRSGTRVELHSALFPASSKLRVGQTFADMTLTRESSDVAFRGRPVRRLSREFQLVYLASAWNQDLSDQSIDPSFVFGLFDAVALTRPPFEWDRVLELVDNPVAAASLDVMLACLVSQELVNVPAHVLERVRRRHQLLGPTEVAILTSLVNGNLLRGRRFEACNSWRIWSSLLGAADPPGVKSLKLPWYVAFPADDPRRFDVRAQWHRLRRWAAKSTAPEG